MAGDLIPPVIATLGATITDFSAKMAEARGEMKATADTADTTSARSEKSAGGLSSIGKGALLGIAGAAAVVGAASVKAAGDFQESMTQLVVGAGESEKNISSLSSAVLSLSGKVAQGPKDLAQALYPIESVGFRGAQGISVLKAAAEGATASGAQLTTVADALAGAMHAFSIPASQATQTMNTLQATVASGKMHLQDLATALGTVGPIAATAHISLQEIGSAMATMTSSGTPAADAATYLKQTIAMLENPSAKAQGEMKALGLSATAVSQNLGSHGLASTLEMLTNAIQAKVGPSGLLMIQNMAKQASAGTQLGNVMSSVTTGTAGYAKTTKSVADVNGQAVTTTTKLTDAHGKLSSSVTTSTSAMKAHNSAAATSTTTAQTYVAALADMVGGTKSMQAALELTGPHMAEFQKNSGYIAQQAKAGGGSVAGFSTATKDFNVKLRMLEDSAKAAEIRLGEFLIPIVSKFMSVVATASSYLMAHKGILIAIGTVIGGFLVVAITNYIAGLVKAAAQSVTAFGTMIGRWLGIVPAAGAAQASTEAAAVGIETAEEGMAASAEATGAAIDVGLGPIGLALAGITIAITLLHGHWKAIWDAIKGVIADAVNWVRGHLALVLIILGPAGALIAAIGFLAKHWHDIWDTIKSVISDAWNFLEPIFDIIGQVLKVVAEVVVGILAVAFIIAWDVVKAAVTGAWAVLKPVFDVIGTVLSVVIKGALAAMKLEWDIVWGAVKDIVTVAWAVLSPIFSTIGSVLSTVVGAAVSALRDLWNGAWDGMKTAVSVMWAIVKPIFDTMQTVISAIAGPISSVVGGLSKIGSGVIGGAVGSVSKLLHFATGGIVTGPTLAMIGESGPEAVVPLSGLAQRATPLPAALGGSGGAMGGSGPAGNLNQTITVQLDGRTIWQAVRTYALQDLKLGRIPGTGMTA